MTEVKIKRRCAIYTRKSSEDGLEQEFNSLHAQREACEGLCCAKDLKPKLALSPDGLIPWAL
jgi:hypothetical protein